MCANVLAIPTDAKNSFHYFPLTFRYSIQLHAYISMGIDTLTHRYILSLLIPLRRTQIPQPAYSI